MKIVIQGAGAVGSHLAKMLRAEATKSPSSMTIRSAFKGQL